MLGRLSPSTTRYENSTKDTLPASRVGYHWASITSSFALMICWMPPVRRPDQIAWSISRAEPKMAMTFQPCQQHVESDDQRQRDQSAPVKRSGASPSPANHKRRK